MNFESEDAFKDWLKVNGYDKADIVNMSSNWASVSIVDGQVAGFIATQEVTVEPIEEAPVEPVEETPNP
jgi:hypothetical protein